MIRPDFVYNLDPTVIRGGRFDDQHCTHDAVSRLGRLLDQLKRRGR
jgi:hypothetical protein